MHQPHRLRADGRSPGDNFPVLNHLPDRPNQGQKVDPMMTREPLVLGRDHGFGQPLPGIFQPNGQTTLAVGIEGRAKDFTIAICDALRRIIPQKFILGKRKDKPGHTPGKNAHPKQSCRKDTQLPKGDG